MIRTDTSPAMLIAIAAAAVPCGYLALPSAAEMPPETDVAALEDDRFSPSAESPLPSISSLAAPEATSSVPAALPEEAPVRPVAMAEAKTELRVTAVDPLGRGIAGVTLTGDNESEWTTGSSGSLTIQGSSGRPTSLTASGSGWAFDTRTIGSSEVDVRIVGRARRELTLDLRLPDGSQPESARIVLEPASAASVDAGREVSFDEMFDGRRPSGLAYDERYGGVVDLERTWSPSSPSFRVGASSFVGRATAEVDSPSRIVFRSELIQIDPETPGPHRIDLRATASVQFVWTSDRESENQFIRILSAERAGDLTLDATWALGQVIDDSLRATNLRPGEWIVMTSRNSDRPLSRQRVALAPGEQRIEVDVPEPEPSKTLFATVSSADGRPIEGDVFFISSYGGGVRATGSSDGGTFLLAWDSILGDLNGDGENLRLTCDVEDLGLLTVPLTLKQASVAFRFAPPATLSVLGLENRKERFVVSLRELNDEGRFRVAYGMAEVSDEFDDGSSVTIDSIQPGRYAVTVRDDDENSASDPYLSRSIVQLRSGINRVELRPAKPSSLTVEYPSTLKGDTFVVRSAGFEESEPGYVRTYGRGIDGRAVIRGLTPGRYSVWCYNDGDPLETEAMIPGPVVQFDPALVRRVELDEGGQ